MLNMTEEIKTPNNTEIDQALKEFEAKNNEGQTAPVNQVEGIITPQNTQAPIKQEEGVSFDTDKEVEKYTAIKFYKETVEPKMVKAVIKYSGGTVKNQRQAEWILLGFVVVAIGISLYLFLSVVNKPIGKTIDVDTGQVVVPPKK
jgi:hypothetical protein